MKKKEETTGKEEPAEDAVTEEEAEEEEDSEGEVECEVVEVDELTAALTEAEEHKERWLRLAAEFENYKKRTAREFDALVQSASENVIRDLLPILDSVDRALAHGESGESESEDFQDGVKMIMEQLPRVLKGRKLVEIESLGKPFDPHFHEALMQIESEEHPSGIIADVVEKGYSLGEKVLRPSKVVVSRGKPEEEESDEEAAVQETEKKD